MNIDSVSHIHFINRIGHLEFIDFDLLTRVWELIPNKIADSISYPVILNIIQNNKWN